MKKAYYLTTPLYYVNSKPHIGHSYTNIAADALARFQRLALGRDEVFFLTGTDEHGQKVAKAAEAAGLDPQTFTDRMTLTFRELWVLLNISQDDYIRTTEPRHVETVRRVWKALEASGELYTSRYTGWYCTPCETFWTQGQTLAEDGRHLCPDCRRAADLLEEENYFFRLSRYQSWLIDEVRSDRIRILPEIRKNEVLGFLENNALQDLCVSRPKSRLQWGIPSPLSDAHVTYVWFDALINYISACGWGTDESRFRRLWPADVHLIGKDILRHHAVYWTILLKALGLEPPRMIFAHGWWVVGGQKMSKSLGNAVDPLELARRYGIDAYRYFLLSETPFGADGTFSEEALVSRFNYDLANDLGNLVHRTLTMCEKYFGGDIPVDGSKARDGDGAAWQRLGEAADGLPERLKPLVERLAFSEALSEIWSVINRANKFIEESAPWKLAKEGRDAELRQTIGALLETLCVIARCAWPFLPATAEAVWSQLGRTEPIDGRRLGAGEWGRLASGGRIAKGKPLFPRIETETDKAKKT